VNGEATDNALLITRVPELPNTVVKVGYASVHASILMSPFYPSSGGRS
jgi:hypothetical protein